MKRDDAALDRLIRDCHQLSTATRAVLEQGYLKRADPRISFIQLNVLRFVEGRKATAVGDIMRFTGATFAAASKMVTRLKRFGWLRSGKHPGDARARILGLTPAGRGIIQRYERIRTTRVRKLLAAIPAARMKQLSDSMEELIGLIMQDVEILGDLCMQCGAYNIKCAAGDRVCRVKAGA